MNQAIAWISFAFFCGALPFSVWIGKLLMGKDIRAYGDGNPGSFNVFRAGGKAWGWLAILLDGLKGAIPVGIATFSVGLEGWALVLTALAPVLGHAYSPFLRFKGGKAIAVTFGIWAGLTSWLAPTLLGAGFAVFILTLKNDRLTIFLGQLVLLIGLILLQPDWTWFAVWVGSNAILMVKQLGR